jgi:sugar/nucleoside kinase (ribokinase family)
MSAIDYLLIGHITCDLIPNGTMAGGTVTYSGHIAEALGYHTAVLTSSAPDYDGLSALDGLEFINIPSAATTTFENVYTENGRVQTLHEVAASITMSHLPEAWQAPKIVHLAPLTNEVDPSFVHQFKNSLIGMTPQGWLRGWDDNGRVYPKVWSAAQEILPLADVVILSMEDLINNEMLWQYWEWSKLLVLTGGPKGCIVMQGDTAVRIPSPPVTEIDATGAGDTFATAYLIRYHQTGDPLDAARFANHLAAQSVTCVGITAVIEKIKQTMEYYE